MNTRPNKLITPRTFHTLSDEHQSAVDNWLLTHQLRLSDVYEIRFNGLTSVINFYKLNADGQKYQEGGDVAWDAVVVTDEPKW